MKRCVKCLLPETKPGLKFNEEGVCTACQHVEMKKNTNYETRQYFLKNLCESYKSKHGEYDCIIAVSGGKDSTYQTHIMKNIYGMNPLLVSVTDDFEHTKAGTHNINNLSETFNCDIMTLHLASDFNRRMTRYGYEKYGNTNWAIDKAIYSWPLKIAIQMNIPLVIYGEDTTWEYGGVLEYETYSAKNQILNDVVRNIPRNQLIEDGFNEKELNQIEYPIPSDIEKIEPIFLSYFYPWDWTNELEIVSKMGFKTLCNEWNRNGYVDNFIQIDSIGYLYNYCVKYRKLGWSQPTHVVSHLIRWGRMTKEDGLSLLKSNEGIIDYKILNDFLRFTGYSRKECLNILDNHTNKDLFELKENNWVLKNDILS
jgi:N-acetyl sugar amidotransferase